MDELLDRYAKDPRVKAISLVNSIARGVADEHSDLDFAVYTDDVDAYVLEATRLTQEYEPKGLIVHLSPTSGQFEPQVMDGPFIDPFELSIGNFVAHCIPLYDPHGVIGTLQARYLPYFDEDLARRREAEWGRFALTEARCTRLYVQREMPMMALQHLHLGVQGLLAGLFVKRRVYPVDYLKRIERQTTEWLGMPELVAKIHALYDFGPLDGFRLRRSGLELEKLVLNLL